MADFSRLHNVYSNDEVRFIDTIARYLLEQGFFLTLINGGKNPVTLKPNDSSKSDIKTNLLGNLSVPAHDVLVVYLNRERVFSLVFEHNDDVSDAFKNEIIFGKYGNSYNASHIIDDIILHNKDYTDILLSTLKNAAEPYEVRPKITQILSDKKPESKQNQHVYIPKHENSACVIRSLYMIQKHTGSNGKLNDAFDFTQIDNVIQHLTSNGYSVFLLENDYMKPSTDVLPLKTSDNYYVVVRSDGGVVGFLKCVFPKTPDGEVFRNVLLGENYVEKKENISISVLNNIWNSNLDIKSFLESKTPETKTPEEDSLDLSSVLRDPLSDEQKANMRPFRESTKHEPLNYINLDFLNSEENRTFNSVANSITELVMFYDITFDDNYIAPGCGVGFRNKKLLDTVYKKIGGIDRNYMKLFVSSLILEDMRPLDKTRNFRKDYTSLLSLLFGTQYGFFEIGNPMFASVIKENPLLKKFFKDMMRKHNLCEKEVEVLARIYRKALHPVITRICNLEHNRNGFMKLLEKRGS